MTMNPSRRGLLGGALAAGASMSAMAGQASGQTAAGDLKLGIASYSFREFQRPAAIRMTRQLGIRSISVKEFHLPYNTTQEERERANAQFKSAGLEVSSGGVIYMQKDDAADIERYFVYAKQSGMPMMVIGPTASTLPIIERFVKQYDIKVAIHNHGPEDKHFPSCRDAVKAIASMDPRVGVCIDIGHETRTGNDLLESIEMSGKRLFDFHIKDLKEKNNAKSQVAVGDGILPIVGMFKILRKMNYQGTVMLEYEIDADAPLMGMAKSFSYMRGVLAGLNG